MIPEEVILLTDHLTELANFTAEDELVGTGQFYQGRLLINILREVSSSSSRSQAAGYVGAEEEEEVWEREGQEALSPPKEATALTESMEGFS